MKYAKSLWSGILLGALCAGTASAQNEFRPPESATLLPGVRELVPLNADRPPFSPRIETFIFDNTNAQSSYLGSFTHPVWANDFSFAGTAWAGATGRSMTGFTFLIFNGAATAGTVNVRVRMYAGANFVYNGLTGVGTPMHNAATFFDLTYVTPILASNNGTYVIGRGPANAAIPVPDGTDQFFVRFDVVNADGTPATNGYGGVSQSGASTVTNAASPGMDIIDYARDQNVNNILDGNTVIGGASDHRQTTAGGLAAAPSFGVLFDAPAVPPAPTFDFACLGDGVTTRGADAIAANQAAWYRFCINSDATDDSGAGRFLDIHTHGSNFDTVIALFDNAGNVLWSPSDDATSDDDGSDLASLQSYGMGRRAPVTDGVQRDGRAYALGTLAKGLPAANGPYHLAVAGAGAAFTPGFQVTGAWAGGAIRINFETNTNGAALAPSIAPVADLDMGQLVFPGGQFPATPTVAFQVHWIRFETCRSTDATNTVTLDFSASQATISWAWGLFDGTSGNRVAFGSDPASIPAAAVFNDTNPLPAGTYYLGLTYSTLDPDYSPAATTNGRWHMRCRQGDNNFNVGVEVQVSWPDCAVCHGACVADYDDGTMTGTPDGGVTIDDLLYYLFIFDAGAVCADVDDGSFTGTQDGGVTIDDLLYFLFRFDAGC